jgi:tRNA modification GTPase
MPVHISLLTPTGRGAVATIGVRGPGAIELVSTCFAPASGQPLASLAAGSVAFGRFLLAGTGEEEAVVGVIHPGEIEVHCHGGVAAAEAVCSALVADGGVRTSWQDWLRQSTSDPIEAAALLALAAARTERTAAILLDQYRGALRSELTAIEGLIRESQTQSAAEGLEHLLARQDIGLHLTQPWRVVLAGRPNAGKSSLLNALLGYQRAIVYAEPGTTRDVLTANTAIDGWPVELADTAGLRTPAGEIEAAGVARAEGAMAAADLILFVADTTAGWDAGLYASVAASAFRLLVVHNKTDLAEVPADGRPAGMSVSAKTGDGIDSLCAAIAASLVPEPPLAQAAVPFTVEQVAALKSAAAHLEHGDAGGALRVLGSLLPA